MRQSSPKTLEICVDHPAAIKSCIGFADRIELCAGLEVGGLTPEPGLMSFAAESGLETHVLIRPRGGDFRMSEDDLAVAVASIRHARDLGLKGVVIGAERDGRLDEKALQRMIAAANGMDVTLHRVVDVLPDPLAAVETAVALGIGRILTSGGAPTAVAGIANLNTLHAAANNRLEIMAGAGINSAVLPRLMAETRLTAFHASCSQHTDLGGRYQSFGFGATARSLDVDELSKLSALCGKG